MSLLHQKHVHIVEIQRMIYEVQEITFYGI